MQQVPVNVSQITQGDIYEIDGRNDKVMIMIMMGVEVKDGEDVVNNVVTSQKGNHKCRS